MRTPRIAPLLLALMALALGCGGGDDADFEFQPLAFPFQTPGDVVRLSAFGIPNWSGAEPHNGIDLVVDEASSAARLVSPTAGVVTSIRASENPFSHPPGQLLLSIEIQVDAEWQVVLVVEPGTVDPALKAAQEAAVHVSVGDVVDAGSPVADLLVGAEGYPHLHYMVLRSGSAVCAYAHSSVAARSEFERIAAEPASNMPDGNICFGAP